MEEGEEKKTPRALAIRPFLILMAAWPLWCEGRMPFTFSFRNVGRPVPHVYPFILFYILFSSFTSFILCLICLLVYVLAQTFSFSSFNGRQFCCPIHYSISLFGQFLSLFIYLLLSLFYYFYLFSYLFSFLFLFLISLLFYFFLYFIFFEL